MQYDYHNLTISFFTPKLQFASISGYPLGNTVDSVSRQAKHEIHSSLLPPQKDQKIITFCIFSVALTLFDPVLL
jgi:hypothetical protein